MPWVFSVLNRNAQYNVHTGWAFEQGNWPGICDACNQHLHIVQSEPCSYGPSPVMTKVCGAGNPCNIALVKAKASYLGKEGEVVMKHYKGVCDGTVDIVTGATAS